MGEWNHSAHLGEAARAYAVRARKAEIAVFVELALPLLREAARSVGYALTEHGSKARDLDLVAIPWTDKAVSAERLIEVLATVCHVATGWGYKADSGKIEPKPHGRVATAILASAEVHLDLSIMPRVIVEESE